MRTVSLQDRDGQLTLKGLLRIVIAVLVGVLLGLALTIRSLDLDNRGTLIGAWRSTPRDGSGEIDPYALAANARGGLLPLGTAEGLTFLARTDDRGTAFKADCDYLVKGPMPSARFWTLSLLDLRGFPIKNPADRYGFTSAEILRFDNDPATIRVSPGARSGNWLPTGQAREYMLMLRLYDTSLSTGKADLDKVRMPTISQVGCRS